MHEKLLLDRSGAGAIITPDRPEVRNAFDLELHAEIHGATGAVGSDPDVRCIVLRGNGPGSSAGADLQAARSPGAGEADCGECLRSACDRLLVRMAGTEKPIVAALHGVVCGAGLGVALPATSGSGRSAPPTAWPS